MYICEACGTDISIHALREEGDQAPCTSILFFYYFYPRPPRGGRLPKEPPKSLNCIISIHALREEGDINARKNCGCTACISIHALREEGDTLRKRVLRPRQRFLSTPSARRATMCLANIDKRMKISIHALREEGDASPSAAA